MPATNLADGAQGLSVVKIVEGADVVLNLVLRAKQPRSRLQASLRIGMDASVVRGVRIPARHTQHIK